jgi:broad specificity phosphatase PhoE
VTRSIVHVLRHGEVYNPDHVLYGRLPGFRLSDAGVDMAHMAAAHLAGRDIAHVVSSPLQRAQETAAPMAAQFGLEIAIDERLIEAGNKFEGKRVVGEGGVLKKPQSWPLFRNPFKPSWGEPYVEIGQRMLAAAIAAKDAANGHEAVMVSHQLPIVTLRRLVEGKTLWHDPRKRQCSLASITSLTFIRDEVVRVEYAEPAGTTPNMMDEQPSGQ